MNEEIKNLKDNNKNVERYIKVPSKNSINDNLSIESEIINSIKKGFNYSTLETNFISNSLRNFAKELFKIHMEMINIISNNNKINPYFKELSEKIETAKKDLHSFLSWLNYYKKLSEYFWIYPYDMQSEKLYTILEKVNNEKEFDNYISKYFSKEKVKELFSELEKNIPRKHKIVLKQIEIAYNSKSYVLANVGLISIIDDLLSFYIYDKGCPIRLNLFNPIIEQLKKEKTDIDEDLFLIMIANNYITNLYDNIEFNEKIEIKTNKKTRRHTCAHGKFYSNKRIDSIMLLNAIYYLLITQEILKIYKNKLFYDNKNGFYIPRKGEKKQAIERVKNSIQKKKEKKLKNNNQNMI